MRKLCERQPVGPIVLLIVNKDSKVLFDFLVNSFSLAICLRMPGGRCVRRDVEQSVKFLHELRDELRASVGDHDDEPPGSVRSEFADLAIHHPIPSKRRHYNPHTLNNTTDFRSISHKHSDTILEP